MIASVVDEEPLGIDEVMHIIDEASPLYGLDAKGLEQGDLEIEISLTGLDDVTMQTVHSSHLYTFHDVRFGYRLADTISPLASRGR